MRQAEAGPGVVTKNGKERGTVVPSEGHRAQGGSAVERRTHRGTYRGAQARHSEDSAKRTAAVNPLSSPSSSNGNDDGTRGTGTAAPQPPRKSSYNNHRYSHRKDNAADGGEQPQRTDE
jgi:hypothetical protein